MAGDPRSSGTYRRTRALWLAGYQGGAGTCCLCGGLVNVALPGNHPYGPSIEHRVPVRRLLTQVQTQAEAIAAVCDTSTWGLAHRRCNNKQGGASSVERQPRPRPQGFTPSRAW
jgi:hypothetical protein